MSEFTTALIVSPLADGKSWVLLQDLKYHIGSIDNCDCVVAAHGFVTDFASVPRIFWWIIPKWGKYGNAAVIHDWLYYRQTAKNRVESDQILYEAMGVLGVVPWKKNSIYYAVRLFGWIAWLRNAAEKENGHNRIIQTDNIQATYSSQRPGTLSSIYTYVKNKKMNKRD